ncbi:MAG: peptidase M28, partial [Verrucomicrobia bacterium]|nr:peptidase M28 [Verrucomicrobiota bacterium]
MKSPKVITFIFWSILSSGIFAQERLDYETIARIKEEGFQNSKVLETLSYISDVYGPRLSGTPDFLEAAEWAKKKLQAIGLENVRFDSYEAGLRGWAIESYSVEMVEPRYMSIIALPSAWTAGTEGEITGVPLLVDYTDLDALKKLSGQLRGKIL